MPTAQAIPMSMSVPTMPLSMPPGKRGSVPSGTGDIVKNLGDSQAKPLKNRYAVTSASTARMATANAQHTRYMARLVHRLIWSLRARVIG